MHKENPGRMGPATRLRCHLVLAAIGGSGALADVS